MSNVHCSEGSFYFRNGRIYVQGTVDGKLERKSIGKKATPLNKKWLAKQDPIEILLNILGIDKNAKDDEISFEDYGYRFLTATSGNRQANTQEEYERIFRKNIHPFFKNYKWNEISSLDVLDFFKKIGKEYSYDRAKRTKNILKNILTSAYDDNIITRNPVEALKVRKHQFKRTPSKTEAYTTAEAKKMLENAEGWLRVFLELALKHGLRTGELIGLKWSDFDLERGFFMINRSITKNVITESSEIIHPNKNHLREIFLFPETIDLLKRYHVYRPHEEWLFVTKYGKPYMQSQTIAVSHLKPFLEKIGVKYKATYATRRCYASIMIQSEKVTLDEVQEVMGHRQGSSITQKHYNLDVLQDVHKQKKAKDKSDIFNGILSVSA